MQNHCQEYKTTEIKKIKELYADGYKIAFIAEVMGRTYSAMAFKCRELGLRRYKLKGEKV